jgi:catechol 2,3-dioxygenase-like lactoylglutathione lyase family enzyme
MPKAGRWIKGIDHVALPFRDLDAATTYYDQLFGVTVVTNYIVDGRPLVRQVLMGQALLSMHQLGNGLDLVAAAPTPGSADLCLRWNAPIMTALACLAEFGVAVVEGPSPRTYSDGRASTSIYFRDLDGNLIELMAPASSGVEQPTADSHPETESGTRRLPSHGGMSLPAGQAK